MGHPSISWLILPFSYKSMSYCWYISQHITSVYIQHSPFCPYSIPVYSPFVDLHSWTYRHQEQFIDHFFWTQNHGCSRIIFHIAGDIPLTSFHHILLYPPISRLASQPLLVLHSLAWMIHLSLVESQFLSATIGVNPYVQCLSSFVFPKPGSTPIFSCLKIKFMLI